MTAGPLTLLASVDLLGRYRYVELALFTALGDRSASITDPPIRRYLAGASMAHGWRARVIEDLLPVSVGLPGTEASTRSPSPAVDLAIARLVADGADLSVLHAVVETVYPQMAAGYRARIDVGSPVPDGPVLRALGRVLDDLSSVARVGRDLLGDRHGDLRTDEIAHVLDAAGGPFGPLVDAR
jgi:hypothetical protein